MLHFLAFFRKHSLAKGLRLLVGQHQAVQEENCTSQISPEGLYTEFCFVFQPMTGTPFIVFILAFTHYYIGIVTIFMEDTQFYAMLKTNQK